MGEERASSADVSGHSDYPLQPLPILSQADIRMVIGTALMLQVRFYQH